MEGQGRRKKGRTAVRPFCTVFFFLRSVFVEGDKVGHVLFDEVEKASDDLFVFVVAVPQLFFDGIQGCRYEEDPIDEDEFYHGPPLDDEDDDF